MDQTTRTSDGPGNALPQAETMKGVVLVADDDVAYRTLMSDVLRTGGCDVLEAFDGAQAVQLAKERLPDLMLVDVTMPGLSGYDVCQRLKSDPLTRNVAVMLVTARGDIDDVERGFEVGAFDYVRKPFHGRELMARVRNALALKRKSDELRAWQERMSRELDVGGRLQRRLLATNPFFGPAFEVHMTHLPCLAVGGDLFDAFMLPDGSLCLYMADVAGHGVAPAIVATLLKAVVFQVARAAHVPDPSVICRDIHAEFCHHIQNPELYATLFFAVLDPTATRWTCMACGHPDPIILNTDGTDGSAALSGEGDVPIGFTVRRGGQYQAAGEASSPAVPGSVLFLFTDGLLEARHRVTSEMCGRERLVAAVRQSRSNPYVANHAEHVLEILQKDGFDLSQDDCSALSVELVDPRTVLSDSTLSPDYDAVAEAAARTDRLLCAAGWSEESAGAAQLAIMEYGSNIVRHGRVPPNSRIGLQIRLTGPLCRILFRDRGREWDFAGRFESTREAPIDRESCRGLSILKAVTAQCDFFRRGTENLGWLVIRKDVDQVMARKLAEEPG